MPRDVGLPFSGVQLHLPMANRLPPPVQGSKREGYNSNLERNFSV